MASVALSTAPSSIAANSTLNPAPAAKSAPDLSSAPARPSATLQPDTVKLSVAAQVKLLHRQGIPVSRIASSLGTNVAAIDKYLGITIAQPAATTAAAVKTSAPADTDSDAGTAKSSPAAQPPTGSAGATPDSGDASASATSADKPAAAAQAPAATAPTAPPVK